MEILWWCSSSGRIELQMTEDEARSVSHPGQCYPDVRYLRLKADIAAQLEQIDPQILARELSEYGAWDADELAIHEDNLDRVIWIAGCDLREEETQKERCA
jgi:hypothetical protein